MGRWVWVQIMIRGFAVTLVHVHCHTITLSYSIFIMWPCHDIQSIRYWTGIATPSHTYLVSSYRRIALSLCHVIRSYVVVLPYHRTSGGRPLSLISDRRPSASSQWPPSSQALMAALKLITSGLRASSRISASIPCARSH